MLFPQSPSKAALPEQLQGFQVAVEQLQHMRDGLSWTQGQPQALEMLLQECQALKTQVGFRTPFYLPQKPGQHLIFSASVYSTAPTI